MIIAILKHRRKKLFISLHKSHDDYVVSCYHEKRKIISKATFCFLIKKGYPKEIYISYLETERRYRRKGYGRILVNFLKNLAKTCDLPITLYSYEESIEFWKKCGFRKIGRGKENRNMIWKD